MVVLTVQCRYSAVYIQFKFNQEKISKELCIEKELEENSCKGSCCLAKSLAQVKKAEQPPTKTPATTFDVDTKWISQNLVTSANSAPELKIRHGQSEFHLKQGSKNKLLRPPISVV